MERMETSCYKRSNQGSSETMSLKVVKQNSIKNDFDQQFFLIQTMTRIGQTQHAFEIVHEIATKFKD